MGQEEPGDFHLIINEWGGREVAPGQVRVVWAISDPGMGNLYMHTILSHIYFFMSTELSLILICLSLWKTYDLVFEEEL
jgi:hypothetical protein